MTKEIQKIDFKTEIAAQDEIVGRLVSGQWFSGKVFSCGADYLIIVTLKVENKKGELEEQDTDLTKMRYDAIMFFDKA